MGVGGQLHAPAALRTGKRPDNHCTGGLWASAPVWTSAENFAAARIRTLNCPTHSEPLYRLRSPVTGRKYFLNIKSVSWFSVEHLFELFLFLRRNQSGIIINVRRSSCKVPVILVRFWWNLSFSRHIFENTQISIFIKIRPVGAVLLYADGRTDMTKRTVAFRNLSNAPGNGSNLPLHLISPFDRGRSLLNRC